jgi:hypothetical protein
VVVGRVDNRVTTKFIAFGSDTVNCCSLEFGTRDGYSVVGFRWRLVEALVSLRSRCLLHTILREATKFVCQFVASKLKSALSCDLR